MDGNNLDELRDLIGFLKANNIAEFEMERSDLKVRLKFEGREAPPQPAALDLSRLGQMIVSAPQPSVAAPIVETVAAAEAAPSVPSAQEQANLHEVRSPIVGTFYESPSPGAPSFVKPGDQVEVGQVLCIIEAMKLMNEIESDVAGEVIRRVAGSGNPVEYGQPLFEIKPH